MLLHILLFWLIGTLFALALIALTRYVLRPEETFLTLWLSLFSWLFVLLWTAAVCDCLFFWLLLRWRRSRRR